MIEHKSFDVECKGLDDAAGTVDFYAAAFSNVDRANERIEPGAFKNLDKFMAEGFIAVDHDWKQLPIATVEHAEQDLKGLRVRAHFHSTPHAQAVRTTIKERISRGKSVKASIGYQVIEDEDVKLDGKSVRSLKAIDLYEASIVNVPCNPAAGVVSAKSIMTIDELRAKLEGFRAELKAGRVLSQHNIDTMLGWADTADAVGTLGADIRSHVAQHMPAPFQNTSPPTPPSVGVPKSHASEMFRQFLATTAKFKS